MIQVPTFYWVSTTPGANASDFAQWSSTPGGPALAAWPGTSPDASDDFVFDFNSTANCTWNIAAVQSIQQSTVSGENYTGIVTLANDVALKGLKLNGEITDGGTGYTMTFSGTPLTSFNDSASKKRYILNGQKAKHGSSSTLLYKIQPGSTDVHLDNGPYNKLTIDTNPMTLAYNVPTASTHDNADDGTIHIKGAFVVTTGSGFARNTAPDAANDTKVKIKFDSTTFTYPADTLDFVMATAFFRGIEIPATGSQTYGSSSAGFTAKHYGVVVFADSNGELSTIPNGVQLDCYSFEVKAGARLRVASASANPAIIKSQTQPKVKGVWSFESLNSHVFTSPRNNPVTSVANGGTGLSSVESNGLLVGNTSTPMQPLTVLPPGTNGYVLTMVSGSPAWAAASGGGGSGTVTSIATTAPITGGTITTTGTIGISAATTSAAGSMSSADKTKLDGIATAATAYADSDAIAAVEGEATLDLTGDVSLAANKELTINESTYSASSKNSDDTKVLVSADSTGTNDALFRIDTDAGFLRIGPQNTGYCHFYTDRTSFYFNRNIEMDGGSFQAYNDDLQILTTTTSGDATRIYVDAGVDECRVGIGNGFTSSNLPEKELHVRGNVVVEDPTSDGSSDHLLEVKSASSSTPDNARILISADTDAKLPMLHLRDIEANSGTFSTHYSAYMALDRGTPIVTGSAQNDLLIANGNLNKDIHFCTNGASAGSQAQAKMTIVGSDGDVGIGTTSPAQKLHVNGTIRQTGATSAVLVANSNGDIGAASALTDTDYSAFAPALSAASWAAPPPATLADAIDRLAAYVVTIPGAPAQIP